jgi:hypothetical protein
MEARVAVEVLLASTARFGLAEGATFVQVPAFFANGPAEVDVVLEPAPGLTASAVDRERDR